MLSYSRYWPVAPYLASAFLDGQDKSVVMKRWSAAAAQCASQPVWPVKSRQMSITVAQKWFLLEKWKISTTLQKLSKNVGILGKVIVATGFEKLPKGP